MPLASILGLWAYIIESASSNKTRGQIDNFDTDVAGFHLGIDVVTPCNAMKRRNMLHETGETLHIKNWEKWQPKREREDVSTDRVRKHRDKQKQELINHENHATPCNANETHVTPREDKIRVDIKTLPSLVANAPKEVTPLLRENKKITFKAWQATVKANGEKLISRYQPVWDYADKLGIPGDWIEIAWLKFSERYESDPTYTGKRYIDWRRHFLNAIEGNWFGLWRIGNDGKFALTTVGVQADIGTREAA